MIRFTLYILFIIIFGNVYSQDSITYATAAYNKIEVNLNQSFIIKLRACHSCGFHWKLEKIDSLKIKLVSVTQENVSGRKFKDGGDVYEFWNFIGINVGTSEVKLVYIGPAREFKENGRCEFEIWVK